MTPSKAAVATALFCIFAASAARADDKSLGRDTVIAAGCVGCHQIPGTGLAGGNVGPSLKEEGKRVYIAGVLPNTRENMIRWITRTQEVHPGDAMPDTPLPPKQAQAVADFLQSLR